MRGPYDNDSADERAAAGGMNQRWRPKVGKAAATLFLLLVAALVMLEARRVHWHDVLDSMHRMPRPALLVAMGLAWTSHALCSCFDLIGRRYTGHALSTRAVMAVNFTSYAFNLNLGTLVGGAGIRFRLYRKLGLALNVIARILTLSVLTNWLGYTVLAGALLIWQPPALQSRWIPDVHILEVVGGLVLLVPLAYLAACGLARKRVVQLRNHRLELPSLRIALAQLGLSCANWLAIAAVIYVLLLRQVDYPAVLGTLLAAAVAGATTQVPGGIGVLEAVFVTLLSDRISKEEVLGGLLTYRGIYYLMPLVVAIAFYARFEAPAPHARKLESAPR